MQAQLPVLYIHSVATRTQEEVVSPVNHSLSTELPQSKATELEIRTSTTAPRYLCADDVVPFTPFTTIFSLRTDISGAEFTTSLAWALERCLGGGFQARLVQRLFSRVNIVFVTANVSDVLGMTAVMLWKNHGGCQQSSGAWSAQVSIHGVYFIYHFDIFTGICRKSWKY